MPRALVHSRLRQRLAASVCVALIPATLCAAEYRPASYEEWSGFYVCEANERDPERWPGYRSQIGMVVQEGRASVVRESARVRETMSGEVSSDGRLELAGVGEWKGGASWRWTYVGRFTGQRFQAQGAMLSQGGTRLRACSMSLTRVAAAESPNERRQGARRPPGESTPDKAPTPPAAAPPRTQEPAVAAPAKPVSPPTQSAAPGEPAAPAPAGKAPKEVPPPLAALPAEPPVMEKAMPKAETPPVPATRAEKPSAAPLPSGVDMPLDLAPNASTRLEGMVSHGAADRYHVAARRGQQLAVELHASGGAVQFDVYAPGAVARREQTAFIVQGARLFSGAEGTPYTGELAADGRHLVLVRSTGERARYTLEIALSDPTAAPAAAPPAPAPAAEAQPAAPAAPAITPEVRGAREGNLRRGAIALLLIVGAAGMITLLQRRRALSPSARYAAIGVIAASGVALLVISGRAPREAVDRTAEMPAAASAPREAPQTGAVSEPAPAAATLVGGTFVCGAARAGETNIVSTFKYYPDGIYVELARTWSDRVPTLTAVKVGTFEWANGKTLTLRQASASPNIEYGEPFVKTSVVEIRSVSGDLTRGYTTRMTARAVAGKPQRVPDMTEECVRDERAGPSMDRLREELRAHLPRQPHPPVAAAKGATLK